MSTITQDSRPTSIMNADSRTAVGTLTQDSRTTSGTLWSATIFPWLATFYPWDWTGTGQIINQDTRT